MFNFCFFFHCEDEQVIVDLIHFYPDAAKIINDEKRLPLHIAVESGKLWAHEVKHIVQAFREAFTYKDPVTNLFIEQSQGNCSLKMYEYFNARYI